MDFYPLKVYDNSRVYKNTITNYFLFCHPEMDVCFTGRALTKTIVLQIHKEEILFPQNC